jgi:hypothetical protein
MTDEQIQMIVNAINALTEQMKNIEKANWEVAKQIKIMNEHNAKHDPEFAKAMTLVALKKNGMYDEVNKEYEKMKKGDQK